MNEPLYSVRMRATSQGEHRSGGERLVAAGEAAAAAARLVERALDDGIDADSVHCRLDRLDPATVRYAALPDIATHLVADWRKGRAAAVALLVRAGVAREAARQAVERLANGAGGSGRVMRGAMIVDATSGRRLEPDTARGVRVSRMDLAPALRPQCAAALEAAGLGHHRVGEALVLAAKVLLAPGLVAELCWSDDPDYTTGYVADPQQGYQRISALKPQGAPLGGRVFFVQPDVCLERLTAFLEGQAVLFDRLGRIAAPRSWEGADA